LANFLLVGAKNPKPLKSIKPKNKSKILIFVTVLIFMTGLQKFSGNKVHGESGGLPVCAGN
jgi:hypothetical protein